MVRIIDTSVAIKWFVLEQKRETALSVLEDLFKNPSRFAVPEVFFFELSHVFNRLIPHPSKEQLELLKSFLHIGLNRFSMTSELQESIRWIQGLGLSGYDAAYVAIAKIIKGQWITFDAKAHQKIRHLGLSLLLE